jgi:hypothetical protein
VSVCVCACVCVCVCMCGSFSCCYFCSIPLISKVVDEVSVIGILLSVILVFFFYAVLCCNTVAGFVLDSLFYK